MNPVVVLLLFAGFALVLHAVHEERVRRLEREVRVEYRFIPRTLYEDQMAQTDVAGRFKGMFETPSPWAGEATAAPPK